MRNCVRSFGRGVVVEVEDLPLPQILNVERSTFSRADDDDEDRLAAAIVGDYDKSTQVLQIDSGSS